MKKQVIQNHHISYDPEITVKIYKGEHWAITILNLPSINLNTTPEHILKTMFFFLFSITITLYLGLVLVFGEAVDLDKKAVDLDNLKQ